MWIDGEVTPDEVAGLSAIFADRGYTHLVQYPGYALMHSERRIWDIPTELGNHRVIAQGNQACTQLRTNFNPTREEIQALRDYIDRHQEKLIEARRGRSPQLVAPIP